MLRGAGGLAPRRLLVGLRQHEVAKLVLERRRSIETGTSRPIEPHRGALA